MTNSLHHIRSLLHHIIKISGIDDISTSLLDLLVIDDLGLMELDLGKCHDPFEAIDRRDGRRSTIIISQFPIKSWFDLFREHAYADVYLAHITDKQHSYRLEMNDISMREAEK